MAKPKGNKRTKSMTNIHSQQHSTQSPSLNPIIRQKPTLIPEGFKFISSNYSTHLECPLCSQLMIRPMRAHPCGHTFCQKCIESYMVGTKWLCPFNNCLRRFSQIKNDRTAENLIDELKVQCTNEGCVYKGVYDNYKKIHKNTCKFKNGGIDAWLGNLTQGMVFTQVTRQSDQLKDGQQSNKLIRRSQTLEPLIEEDINENSQDIENKDCRKFLQNEEKKETSDKENSSDNMHDRNFTREEEKEEKQEDRSTSNPFSLQNSRSNSSGMDLNFSIFNIPFGPSFREQIQSSTNQNDQYLQKEIKKLQG